MGTVQQFVPCHCPLVALGYHPASLTSYKNRLKRLKRINLHQTYLPFTPLSLQKLT